MPEQHCAPAEADHEGQPAISHASTPSRALAVGMSIEPQQLRIPGEIGDRFVVGRAVPG